MKLKNDGISLLISLGISVLVLGMAVAMITSLSRTLQQTTAIERSNQVFFAAESGIEAALFHHNARGAGVHFMQDPVPSSQQIFHAASRANVEWTIDGRTKPIAGSVRENQAIEIAFFWDNGDDPKDTPPLDVNGNFDPIHPSGNAGVISDDITLTFDNTGVPAFFDFGDPLETDVLFDWALSAQHNATGPASLVATKNGDVCDVLSAFYCEDEFLTGAGGPTSTPVDSTDNTVDKEVLPGRDPTSTQSFFSNTDYSQYKLSFRPLLPFEDSGGVKISSISYTVDHGGAGSLHIPKPVFTISSNVAIGDFEKTISIDINEKTSLGAFDYVIFD